MAKLIGTVTRVVGEVFAVAGDGSRRALVQGDRVFTGEQLQTGAIGAVAVHLADGGELTLGRDSSMPLTSEILANHATHIDTPDTAAPSQAQLAAVQQLQQAIAAGDDPSITAEPAAAGPATPGPPGPLALGGGHSFVLLEAVGGHVDPVIGFPTDGLSSTPIFPEGDVAPFTGSPSDAPILVLPPAAPPALPPVAPPPPDTSIHIVGSDVLTVNEANLPLGSAANAGALTQSGSFTINAADGLRSLSIDGVNVITNGASIGFPQSIETALGNTLIVTGYNPQTGVVTYAYTLNGADTHPAGEGANSISEHFNVVATNNDGNVASGSLDVNIIDDMPTARDDSNPNTASESLLTLTGNVLSNDTQGADRILTGPIVGGTFVGTYGTLVLAADGTYTYTLNAHNPDFIALHGGGNGIETFTYTLKDADGDTSQANLVLNVHNNDDPVTLDCLNVRGGELTVYEKNLSTGTHPNADALTQRGEFVVHAPDGLQSLSVGGINVIVGGVVQGFPLSVDTVIGSVLTITGYNAETGVVSYSYTLQHNALEANGDGANSLTEHFTVVATDGDNSSATGVIDVKVVDDVPIAHADADHVVEGGSVSVNVLGNDKIGADGPGAGGPVVGVRAGGDTSQAAYGDLGTSIGGTYGTLVLDAFGNATYHSYPDSVSAPGAHDVFTYSIRDADGDVSTTTLSITVEDSCLKAVSNQCVTVFENALDLCQTGHDLAPGKVVGSNPDSPAETGSGSLVGSVSGGVGAVSFSLEGSNNGTLTGHYGEIHLNSNGTYTYTLTSAPKTSPMVNDGANVEHDSFTYTATDALGNTVTSTIVVNIVDDVPAVVCSERTSPVVGVNSNLLLVTDLNDLNAVLTGTVHGAPITGSLMTGGSFGADGGFIKAIIVDGTSYLYDPKANHGQGGFSVVGAGHGSFDTTSNSVTVTSHNGGKLVVDMDNGEYTYTPPKVASAGVTETFGFVASDNDGDVAGANLVVHVNPNCPPVAVADNVITHILSPNINVPAQLLLANDTHPNGDKLTASPTTFNTGWAAKGADFTAANSTAIKFTGMDDSSVNQLKTIARSDFFDNSGALTALVVLNGYLGAPNASETNAQDLYTVTLHKGETVTLSNSKGDGHVAMQWQDVNGAFHTIADGSTFSAANDGVYHLQVRNIDNTSGHNVSAAESYQLKVLVDYSAAQNVTPDYHGTYTANDGHGGTSVADVNIHYQAGNTLQGTHHNDVLISGPGNHLLDGGAGNNTDSYANATAGVHVDLSIIKAQNPIGAGVDTLAHIDTLIGSHFNDTLTGGHDNNIINGGQGNDILNGGGGDDILIGGLGNNTLTGGSGNDTFKWEQGNVGHDLVTDFSIGVDKLDLSQLLHGENSSTASLDDYLHFKVSGSGESVVTTIEVNPIVGQAPTQTIDLAGVDVASHYGVTPGSGGMIASGHDTASIINGMISHHSLKVDTV